MAKFFAIDYGLERTGLAASDPSGSLVFPLSTLKLADFGARRPLLDALAHLAAGERAEIVVIGLPLREDGSESEMCRIVSNMVARLKRRLDLPMYYMPEILSSREAMADLRAIGLKWQKAKAVLDQQAACRILSSFLAQSPKQWIPA